VNPSLQGGALIWLEPLHRRQPAQRSVAGQRCDDSPRLGWRSLWVSPHERASYRGVGPLSLGLTT
jgi:hypothetical protein